MRRALLLGLALIVLLLGYATLDVFDIVPGVLTRAGPAPAPTPVLSPTAPGPTSPLLGSATAGPAEPLAPLDPHAPAPTAAGLAATLRPLLADPALGSEVGLSVRDGVTGAELYSIRATTPLRPASTLKLLSTAAIWTSLSPSATMTTSAVAGSGPGQVVLVAGGDTMLARGAGSPTAVEGHAGLGDLAGQVANRLREAGQTRATVSLDLTYDAGPRYPATWHMADVRAGYTQGVAMVGLAGERPSPGRPSPARPEVEVAKAFVAALQSHGIAARLAASGAYAAHAPAGSEVLGEVRSASYLSVLTLALDESDDALLENIARQAAVAAGRPSTFAGVTSFVLSRLSTLGIDTTGLTLLDASGLSSGNRVTVRALTQVLALAASGTDPALEASVAGLPVSGLTGTLSDRFGSAATRAVAGIPRAKTGTLTGTSAVAGTTVDTDGRLLLYAVIADQVPPTGTDAARAALDRLVTGLTGCGCR